MVSCGECNSTDVDIEENFCNECGEELQEEAKEEKLIVVGVIREVLEAILEAVEAVFRNFWRGWGATNFFKKIFFLPL